MKLLLVDDTLMNLKLLRAQLESNGHAVLEAQDGVEALDVLAHQTVDAVISDILMPRMDGYRLCREIRRHEAFRELPIIIYTSTYTSPEDEKLAFQVGANKYLKKPTPIATILSALTEVSQTPRPVQPLEGLDEIGVLRQYSERLVAKLEQKSIELEARQEELKLHATALAASGNAIVITDEAGTIVSVNPAFVELTGYTAEEAIGQTPRILKSGVHGESFYRHFWATISAGQTWRGEFTNRRKDGTLYQDELTVAPVCANGSEVTHFIGVMKDVTTRRKAEEDLRSTHAALRQLLAHTPVVIYRLKVEGQEITPVFVSDNIERLLGFSVNEVLSFEWWLNHLHGDDRQRLLDAIHVVLGQKEEYKIEYRIAKKNGHYRWIEDNCRMIRDASGEPIEIVGAWTDITERKEAQTALVESEERLRLAAQASNIGYWDWNIATHEVIFSKGYARQLGYEEGELANSYAEWDGRLHPDDRAPTLQALRAYLNGHRPEYAVEFRMRHKNGSYRWLYTRGEVVSTVSGDPTRMLGCHVDITERKRAEDELAEERNLFRTLMNHLPDLIFVKDTKGQYLLINEAFQRLARLSHPDEALGKTAYDLFPEGIARCLTADDQGVFETRQPIFDREGVFANEQGEQAWYLMTKVPLCNSQGEVTGLVGISRDITQRKKLEAQFLRAQRLESIGILAGGVAHDLNNILAPMMMAVHLLKEEVHSEKSRQYLSLLESNAQRGADLVKQILTFSRGSESKQILLSPKHVLTEVWKVARETFHRAIQIRRQFQTDLWPIQGDPTHLHQVLTNLCVNARDAMPNGGTLTLKASNVEIDEVFAAMMPGAHPGPHVLLEVNDTGSGIPREILDKIFDPFFTTKSESKGTGLGLSTVLGIVKGHRGFLSVETEIGKGTSFKVYLPAKPGAETDSKTAEPKLAAVGRGELILVVDDEEPIRRMAQTVLNLCGYEVAVAADGPEAILFFAQHSDKVQAVITDLMMPYMPGEAVIQAVRKIRPDIKTIASSGVIERRTAQEWQSLGADMFLAKPYTAEALVEHVHRLLQQDKTH